MALKKILILSSFGGYGHIASANTLQRLLSDEYEFKIIYPIKELRICGLPSGEEFYNWLIANNLNRFTNLMAGVFTPSMIRKRHAKLEKQIGSHVEEYKPDIIISLIPLVNFPASEVARKHDLPLLLVTTDNDLKNWVESLEKRTHTNFKVTIGADLPTTKGTLMQHGVPEEVIQTIGLPLRPQFIKTWDKEKLREEYGIAASKNVVLIMMGGTGSRVTYKYVKTLLQCGLNLHLVVCTGRSTKLGAKLKKITPQSGNSMDIIPFTEKVHELFALADLLITKPGPGSVNEALSQKLPILIDKTNVPLFWEAANIDLVIRLKVGACVPSYHCVVDEVRRFLFDEQTKEGVLRAYQNVPKNCFAEEIKGIIEQMIGVVATGEAVVASRNITSPL